MENLNRNLFPLSGKVVVFDDVKQEVEGLLDVLSNNLVPYIYLDSISNQFQNHDNLGIRLVFLDLVVGTLGDKNTVAAAYSNMNKMIKKDNGPYIVIIWSKNKDQLFLDIQKAFSTLEYPPSSVLSLEKKDYLISDSQDSDIRVKKLNKLIDELNSAMVNCQFLQYVTLWENHVNKSSIGAIDEFYKIIPEKDKDGTVLNQEKLANVYSYYLASLMLGQSFESLNNEQMIEASFEGLNILHEKINNYDLRSLAHNIKNINVNDENTGIVDNAKINTLLHLGKPYGYLAPKSVIKCENNILKEVLIDNMLIDGEAIYVMIDITHKCLLAQNKLPNNKHQFVYGVLVRYKDNKLKIRIKGKDGNFVKDQNGNYKVNTSFSESYAELIHGGIFYKNINYSFIIYKGYIDSICGDNILMENEIFSISDECYNEIRSLVSNYFGKIGKTELMKK